MRDRQRFRVLPEEKPSGPGVITFDSRIRLVKETIMEPAIEAAARFYDEHYDVLFEHVADAAKKRELGDWSNRLCRWCGNGMPRVTFRKVAHAIPQAFGNRGLTVAYECDGCNERFGGTIESDLGTWSMPRRTASLLRGQNGVPTLKKGSSGGWRIEFKHGRLEIQDYEHEPISKLDEANKKLALTVTVGTYTPVAVLKAFVRIGLLLLPEDELAPFAETFKWVAETDHSKSLLKGAPICHTPQNGPMPPDKLVAFVLRRKPGVVGVPYAYLVLGYGNDIFQVILPARVEDAPSEGKTFSIVAFPTPGGLDPARYGRVQPKMLDLSSREKVKGEKETLGFGFDKVTKVDLRAQEKSSDAALPNDTPACQPVADE